MASLAMIVAAAGPHRSAAQDAPRLRQQVAAYTTAHDTAIVRELADFVSIPNLASDSAGVRRNAEHLLGMLRARGIDARLLPGPAGAPSVVFGTLRTPGATRTVIFYAHYDGQPLDPAQWATPPWQATLRDAPLENGGHVIAIPATAGVVQGEWRLYGRSASDDKAPIVAMLSALDALRAAGRSPSVNLGFFFEGEEEAGSPHLHDILVANAPALAADAWLFCDGPIHQSRRQQIVYGARGVMGAELTVYGPSHGLHSGHYGNWAPNPIARLATLLAGMRDDDGHILIKHYYDDVAPIAPAARRALSTIPSVDSMLRADVELAATEANDAPLVERIMLPAINFRGITGGGTSNTIPTEATVSIDFRLVPNETPAHIRALVEAYLRDRGYVVVDHTPTRAERMAHAKIAKVVWEPGYRASQVAMDSPLAKAVSHAVSDALTTPIVNLPMLGGSLPLSEFEDVLHTPLIVLPIVNHDNNQHAANENVRMRNVFDGVAVYASVMTELGQYWEPRAPK